MLKVLVLLVLSIHRVKAEVVRSERGSVTLEQVAIAAGLLAIALAAVAVIGTAVVRYTSVLN